jgi:dTDP-4-amino-4,6-dideoxygalactose transaminase
MTARTASPAAIKAPPAFTKDFTRPMSIPEEGIAAAVDVMRSGRLFRYCATSAETSQVAMAEKEFAEMVNQKYALGVNSCSSAIMLALMAVGVTPGDQVITNGFTFTALPSTIMRLGAEPVLVEATRRWTMDLDDLEKKVEAFPDAKVLLLSHMRGKVADMDRVVEICDKHGLTLVEDCAHSCGVTWRGKQLGYHAKVTAYSTQSDKVINSGEGGFITTDDDEIAAKIIYLSGCYERRYGKHAVRPDDELCEAAMAEMPNLSTRMNEVTAAVMRPLIKNLPERVAKYNARYDAVVDILNAEGNGVVVVPKQDDRVSGVGDHLNFYLEGVDDEQNAVFRTTCVSMGVPVSWFQSQVNARWHVNWRKYGAPEFDLPATDATLRFAYDLKMPPYFEDEDFPHLAKVIAYAANVAAGNAPEAL